MKQFNPAPGWPPPQGWVSPKGWRPDPAWPPAPKGWQLWIDPEAEQRAEIARQERARRDAERTAAKEAQDAERAEAKRVRDAERATVQQVKDAERAKQRAAHDAERDAKRADKAAEKEAKETARRDAEEARRAEEEAFRVRVGGEVRKLGWLTKIVLYENEVWRYNGKHRVAGGSLRGCTASVEVDGQVQSRLTATRMATLGVFALAAPKRKDDRQVHILVEGKDFAFMMSGKLNQGASIGDYRAMSMAINNRARQHDGADGAVPS